ncbi:MAG: MarR family winged helix-turn-helix transcriptional regulator [Candidatus Dormibacteria bacterium]
MKPGAGVGFLISQLGYVISGRFKDLLTPLGVEPRHFLVLRNLANSEGSSQHALGQALHIPPSRMVGIVDSLEQRGLVERRSNPRDRRARALFLTGEGRRMLNRTFQVAVEHERAICGELSAAERDQLLGLLSRLGPARQLIPGVHPALAHEANDEG